MKTCKKCIHYIGIRKRKAHRSQGGYNYHEEKYCNAFDMDIHSTLNATHCMKYQPFKNEEENKKKKIRKKKSCIGCESNKEGYCLDLKAWCSKAQKSCPKLKVLKK